MGTRARQVAGPIVVIAGSTMLAVVALSVFVTPPLLRGFLLGATSTAFVASTGLGLLASSDRAWTRLQGASAEQYTAAAFTSRRRRRAGWRITHGLHFVGDGDVDHVAVGPTGVFAIETKWVGTAPWRIVDGRLFGPIDDPIAQARRAAGRIRSFLGAGRPAPRLVVDVQAVLVVWGPGAPDLAPGGQVIDGVRVVHGPVATHWSPLFDGEPELAPELRAAVADRLERYDTAQVAEVTRRRGGGPRRAPAGAASSGSSRR